MTPFPNPRGSQLQNLFLKPKHFPFIFKATLNSAGVPAGNAKMATPLQAAGKAGDVGKADLTFQPLTLHRQRLPLL